jgi:hypothetical protein
MGSSLEISINYTMSAKTAGRPYTFGSHCSACRLASASLSFEPVEVGAKMLIQPMKLKLYIWQV